MSSPPWQQLANDFDGELHRGRTMRLLYATDASEYQELPAAVALPRTEAALATLLTFARQHRMGLIPRTAGTSLAGQVVGNGIVVDVGRHLSRIVALDAPNRRVRVQPGVVRNELNHFLQPHGLMFGPETSTANRAMIGGMVGNNSCGANSIVYGTTRDNLESARGFLSDGSEVTFGPLTPDEFDRKCTSRDSIETRIYCTVRELLGDPANRACIRDAFPKPSVTRRNTGYALDMLMDCAVFDPASEKPFNLCRLIAGSEGTLFLGVEFELVCVPIPPPSMLLCAHFPTVHDSLKATVIAMRYQPFGCELIDRQILNCTRANREQAKNRFFIEGDPGAVLVVEFRDEDKAESRRKFAAIVDELRDAGLGYAFPIIEGADCDRVWELRRAGQGLVNNVVGDAKPRENVEDTAVAVEDLPNYIEEFDRIMREKYRIECIYYAHAGAGELHTRPLFNLKTAEGLKMFRDIATDVAALVKKYRGSLSGEHGDGRLRGEFIKFVVGDACYEMMRRIKTAFDPAGIFNPNKIIDTPPMDTQLRHDPSRPAAEHETVFDYSSTQGIVRAAEACTGVGECRKSHLAGGTMCPSYMATRNEQDTTRARANALRHALSHPPKGSDPWDSEDVKAVMDLCLSCKGCKSECPSSVDLARMKAEWQQHYYDAHGVPRRTRVIASFAKTMRWAARAPSLYNRAIASPGISRLIKRFSGFAADRSLPGLHATTLSAWHRRNANPPSLPYPHGRVHLFCDEFTNYHDTDVGIKAIELLNRLGYEVVIPRQVESGRAPLSKGLVRTAQKLATKNVELLDPVISESAPLIGIEPSAILGFRDEFPDLVPGALKPAAQRLAQHALLFDEFFARETEAGRIRRASFQSAKKLIRLHGHCHQKALASLTPTVQALELPEGYEVHLIPSGCCGMAGSFGYEAEHFALSQQIGELVLFPAVRAATADTIIAAPGTSCRHQIKDGTGRIARHPAEILHDALLR